MVLAVIPARYDSVRLPGKALADIGGRPMVVRVWERARHAADEAVVATDDDRIEAACVAAGIRVVRTGPCENGTARVAEAARGFADARVVVNVQGDEPLVHPATIAAIAAGVTDDAPIATGVGPLADPSDPARVKVVVGHDGRALYFSRLAIPAGGPWLQHVGVYAFAPAVLRDLAALPRSPLEESERLEQLRWLAAGLRIRAVPVEPPHPSVDTPADLDRVRALWSTPELSPRGAQ